MIKIISIVTEKRVLFDWTSISILKPKTLIERAFNVILKKISKYCNSFDVDIFSVERINKEVLPATQNKTYLVQTIHRDDLDEYNTMLKNIKTHIEFFFRKYKAEKITSKMWETYHNKLIEPYAEISFGYSITVHKAQGSTFKIVLVDVGDISENSNTEEVQKSLYTAAGRPSKNLGFIL